MSCSVTPSAKYSCVASPERLTSGKTASERILRGSLSGCLETGADRNASQRLTIASDTNKAIESAMSEYRFRMASWDFGTTRGCTFDVPRISLKAKLRSRADWNL